MQSQLVSHWLVQQKYYKSKRDQTQVFDPFFYGMISNTEGDFMKQNKLKMISYHIIQKIVMTTVGCLITAILIFIFKTNLIEVQQLIEIAFPCLFGYLYLKAIISPIIEAKTFTFDITKQRLTFKKGVYKKNTVMIPIHRIQHVTNIQTPLSNTFDVGNIVIVTTNGTHQLKFITKQEANDLIEEISHYVFIKQEQVSDHE